MKKQSYLNGALILVCANFLVKIIGAIFKIPLAGILEEEGMAIFNTAYNLYAALFVVATAGLPVAISKMVAASRARGRYTEVNKIFKAAVLLLSLIGIIGSLILCIGARGFAFLTNSPSSYLSVLAISPAVFLVAILSAFRGYFQGHKDMIPTAISEVVEALGKLLIGLLLAYVLIPTGVANASAGAVLGVTAGIFFALLIMVITYVIRRKNFAVSGSKLGESRKTRELFNELFKIAVPITVGSAVMSLTNIIDMVMIRQRLQTIMVTPEIAVSLTEFFGLSQVEAVVGQALRMKPAEVLYGSYSGYAVPMFNLPPTIVMALSMSIVPYVSDAFALKELNEVKKLSGSTLRITLLFSFACAVGMSVLSQPILATVYNNARAATMLFVLSYAVIFVCLTSVTTAMLQGAGYVNIPLKNMAIGAVVKIVSNYFLVAMPGLNIGGAPISTNLCYLTIAVLNIISIVKIMKPDVSFFNYLTKLIVASLLMGAVAFGVYQLAAKLLGAQMIQFSLNFLPNQAPFTPVLSGERVKIILALGIAILVAVIIYAALIFMLRLVKRSDVEMMPKGEFLARVLDKFNLLS